VAECRRRWPTWDFDRIELNADVDLELFCQRYRHRPPDRFADDVVQRADRFLERFAPGPPSTVLAHHRRP
jgi:hypothetical protein